MSTDIIPSMRTRINGVVDPQLHELAQQRTKLLRKIERAKRTGPEIKQLARLQDFVANSSALVSRSGIRDRLGMSYDDERDVYLMCGYTKTLRWNDFASRYIRQDVAKRLVNVYPDATWRARPEIYEAEKRKDTTFDKEIARLIKKMKVYQYLNRVDKMAGIGQYAILLLGFDDGRKMDQPLKKASKLLYIQPYTQDDAPISVLEEDKTKERYGQPKYYQIKSTNSLDGYSSGSTQTFRVHHSRVLHVADGCLGSDVFGTPRLEAVYNRLQDLELVVGGSTEMYWRGGFPGYSFEADPDSDFTQTSTDLDDEIEEYVNGLNRYIRLQGIKVNSLAPEISDSGPQVDVLLKMISISSQIPLRILEGSERGELASSQDMNSWEARIDERRKDFAEPDVLRKFVNKMIEVGIISAPSDMGEDGDDPQYIVFWPDLGALSEKEVAAAASSVSAAVASYLNAGGEALMSPFHFLSKVLKWSDEEIEANLDEVDELLAEEEEKAAEDALNNPQPQIDPATGLPIAGKTPPALVPFAKGAKAAAGKKPVIAPVAGKKLNPFAKKTPVSKGLKNLKEETK